MSHGLGTFQRSLLAAVTEGIGQVNLLSWHLATIGGHLNAQGDIDASYYSQFRKALKALEPKHILTQQRFLAGFDELERYYPSLSRYAEIRGLRQKLLPVIRAYVEQRAPRYDPGDNEKHLLGRLPQEQRTVAEQQWREMRSLLFQCARTHPSDAVADAALTVRLKGDELLFPDARFASSESLGQTITAATNLLPADLQQLIVEFYRATWPQSERNQAKLKSQLILVADFRSSKKPVLQKDFLEWLDTHPDPSIRAQVVCSGRLGSYRAIGPPKPTETLEKILLRDAIKRFQFIRTTQGN